MIPSTYMEAHTSNFKILDAELWFSQTPGINMVNGDVRKENIRTHKMKFKKLIVQEFHTSSKAGLSSHKAQAPREDLWMGGALADSVAPTAA